MDLKFFIPSFLTRQQVYMSEMTMKIDEAKHRLRCYSGSDEIVEKVHDKIKEISKTTIASYYQIVLPLFEDACNDIAAGREPRILQK